MSTKAKRNPYKLWDRPEGKVSLVVMGLAALGMALPVAVVWGALMLWHQGFRRQFTDWYMRWVLLGLIAAVTVTYTLGTQLNVPPGWVTLLLVGGGAYVGLRGRV